MFQQNWEVIFKSFVLLDMFVVGFNIATYNYSDIMFLTIRKCRKLKLTLPQRKHVAAP
jgi:hypothetical protein